MSELITNDDASYALELVRTICKEAGPGLPGSSQEHHRAAILKEELESHLGRENVKVEKFAMAPWALLAAFPVSASLLFIATLLNISAWYITGVSPRLIAVALMLFSIVSPLPFIFEFLFSLEFLDPFFRKKQSVNVIGTLRKPGTRNINKVIILSGHHDSAAESTWLRFLGLGFLIVPLTMVLGFIAVAVMSTISAAGLITGKGHLAGPGNLGWGLLVYPVMPSVIFGMFFTRGKKNRGSVPGAVDNLSGCALSVAMCRYLINNPSCIPEDTEIRFITFGSEEAGLRGSRSYVKSHLEELKRLNVRMLNLETVAHPEILILTSDINGFVKNSPEMVRSLVAAAKHAGVPYKVQFAIPGAATDAGPFSKAGLRAATLLPFKIPGQMAAFYHQKWDNPDMLSPEPFLNVLKLTREWISTGGETISQPS